MIHATWVVHRACTTTPGSSWRPSRAWSSLKCPGTVNIPDVAGPAGGSNRVIRIFKIRWPSGGCGKPRKPAPRNWFPPVPFATRASMWGSPPPIRPLVMRDISFLVEAALQDEKSEKPQKERKVRKARKEREPRKPKTEKPVKEETSSANS